MKDRKTTKIDRVAQRLHVILEWQKCRGDLDRVSYRTGKRRSFVEKWVQRYRKFRNVKDTGRSGRPRRLTAQQAAALSAAAQQQQSVPKAVAQLRKEGVIPKSVSIRTARRAVALASSFKTPVARPLLSAAAKQKRVNFSQRRIRLGNLVAIDSSIFRLFGSQPRRGMWVPKGTRPVQPKPIRSQKLHVYGGISKHGKTKLVFATGTTGKPKRYCRADGTGMYAGVCAKEFQDIMKKHLYPEAKLIMQAAGEPDPVFLLDGAPPHTARDTTNFLTAKNIQYLHGWPPNSPDLNPIENLWAHLKCKLNAQQLRTTAALRAGLEKAWEEVPAWMLQKLMGSFSRRLRKCIQRGGEHTGY